MRDFCHRHYAAKNNVLVAKLGVFYYIPLTRSGVFFSAFFFCLFLSPILFSSAFFLLPVFMWFSEKEFYFFLLLKKELLKEHFIPTGHTG